MAEVLDAERGTETCVHIESVARRRFEPSRQRILITYLFEQKADPCFFKQGFALFAGAAFRVSDMILSFCKTTFFLRFIQTDRTIVLAEHNCFSLLWK